MLRRIIKLGKETFVISLPSVWVKQHKLKKGDSLEVEEEGPRLAVYPASERAVGRVSVDVSGTEPVTKRILGALYKAGYDELEITFESQAELEVIQRTVRESFVGFEIVSKSKNVIVVKNVSEQRHDEFNTLLRRVFLLLIEVGDGCFKAIASDNSEMLQSTALLDDDINRYVNFCRRTLNVMGHKYSKRVAPVYYMVEQLERAGDYYKNFCKNILENKFVTSSLLKDTIADVNAFVRKFYDLYYKFDFEKLTELWQEKVRLEKNLEAALGVAKKDELYPLFLISQVADGIAGANGALLTAKL